MEGGIHIHILPGKYLPLTPDHALLLGWISVWDAFDWETILLCLVCVCVCYYRCKIIWGEYFLSRRITKYRQNETL